MCNGLMQMPARARPPRPAPRAAPLALYLSVEAGTPVSCVKLATLVTADDSDLTVHRPDVGTFRENRDLDEMPLES